MSSSNQNSVPNGVLLNSDGDVPVLTTMSSNATGTTTTHIGGSKKFCLPIQAVIHEYHLKHGLRHQDFFRYRGYCSRRLKHIRKTLKFTQTSHKKHFQKRPVNEDNIKDLRYLEIVLLSAERAWAHAMQLKDESELEPRRIHHSIRKLSDACEMSKILLRICSSDGPKAKVDTRTAIEANAYHQYMEGVLAQNRRKWADGLQFFKKSVALYERIKMLLDKDSREPYEVQISEVKPLINFCAYNLGESVDQQSPEFPDLILDFDEKLKILPKANDVGESTLTSFEWLGQKVQVNVSYWSTFLSSIDNFKKEINKALNEETKISFLDNLLDETRQVQAKLKEEVKLNEKQKASSAPNKSNVTKGVSKNVDNPIMFLLGYVTFIKLSNSIQKNILFLYNLVSKESGKEVFSEEANKLKAQTFLKFFESCSDFLDEILAIPYVEQFGDHNKVRDGLLSHKEVFSSFSLYELGRCYSAQSEWVNALALFCRAKQIATSTNEQKLVVEGFDNSLTLRLLRNLLSFIDSEVCSTYTLCISSQYSSSQESSSGATQGQETSASSSSLPGIVEPLDKHLDTWVKLPPSSLKNLKITSLPPEYCPVPAKPLFFDIASNHIALPAAVQQKVQASNQAKSGLGGYLRGWWGSGKK